MNWVLVILRVDRVILPLVGYLSLEFFFFTCCLCNCVLCRDLSGVERALRLERHGQRKCKIRRCYLMLI